MKYLFNISCFIVLLTLFSCSTGDKRVFDGTIKVSGTLTNAPEGKPVLSQFVDDSNEAIDELELKSGGKFEYELKLEGPGFYELNLMDKKIVRLALYDQDVQIFYDFDDENSLKIEGSEDSKNMLKIESIMTEYQEKLNELNDAYFEAMSKRDQEAIKAIQNKAMEMESVQGQKVKETLEEMRGSFAAMAGISLLNLKNDFLFVDQLVSELNEKYPDTKMIQVMGNQLNEMRALSIGQIAPEISLPDPDGNLVNLSDLRGKYVLIDFWAAWCRPCRQENPNVVKLYNEYNEKGFEVFGVSLDRTKDAWVKAIAEDELTWTHVSDLKYFNSAAAALYQINAIPATYMLDPEGKIIAKDLRGASLENKLKEIFN
ncbi:redoxin domain-containing protein [Aquiflexum sp.]|uniref:redoxin domain-containing protein n=1 Tax=Aquiflexum sp. TaxID=1872584 RepID=UPI00359323EA